jgi:Leucine-rich repeat (LRR) protein
VKSYFINPGFADAFSESLKLNKNLHSLALSNNKLVDSTFYQILDNLPPNLKKLDISKNPLLSVKSYKDLCITLLRVKSKLTHLNCEGNNFGDDITAELCKCLGELRGI